DGDVQKIGAVFDAGAPEMSVTPYAGGCIAIYTAMGFGPSIVARYARSPEGPWSLPIELYHCPEKGLLLYGAKAHSELGTTPTHLIITYCRNTGSLEEHRLHPEIYVPQFIE